MQTSPNSLKGSFWSLFRFKSRSRSHASERSDQDIPPSPVAEAFDALESQKDGFYRYSESLLEENAQLRMSERSSDGKKYSFGQDSGCFMVSLDAIFKSAQSK